MLCSINIFLLLKEKLKKKSIWEHSVKLSQGIGFYLVRGEEEIKPSSSAKYLIAEFNSKLLVLFGSVVINWKVTLVKSEFLSSYRSEEKCLVRSGLVQLMDRLCSLSSQAESSSNEKQTKKQKVATMAWAAFQVLANRCVEWEKEEGRNATNCPYVVCLIVWEVV